MPISLSPELGFEVSNKSQEAFFVPAPPITNLSPEEIVAQFRSRSENTEGGIPIPNPFFHLAKLRSISLPSFRETARQLRSIVASNSFML